MANTPQPIEVIYCANGNKRFAQIAIDAGFEYGAQLPGTVYHPIMFADQNWKNPNRERYMIALAKHQPRMATVLDLETSEQLGEVLAWAEEAAQHVIETVIIIPKAFGIIEQLPRTIGGRQVRLGYSVPTRYGGTELPVWEFASWPVHLLGGSPHAQMKMTNYMDVRSADGNYAQLMASRHNEFWRNGKWHELQDFIGKVNVDAPYLAFAESCRNIMAAWRQRKEI
jgi:hypothetical protein